ncbi:MAG: hypothetical protein BWY49_00616 [Candidatus Omnitrophica bacterium ADurb.Bin314]|nr:MAG: hypothetical protein BWY49_00616 [Candidatus Omnitrophica bacterium ADurb.Bin314]
MFFNGGKVRIRTGVKLADDRIFGKPVIEKILGHPVDLTIRNLDNDRDVFGVLSDHIVAERGPLVRFRFIDLKCFRAAARPDIRLHRRLVIVSFHGLKVHRSAGASEIFDQPAFHEELTELRHVPGPLIQLHLYAFGHMLDLNSSVNPVRPARSRLKLAVFPDNDDLLDAVFIRYDLILFFLPGSVIRELN